MADYYSLLARAVGNLPDKNAATARKSVYDRAKKALLTQLRSLRPPLPEADIAREEGALDSAIARLEGESALASATSVLEAPADEAAVKPPEPPPLLTKTAVSARPAPAAERTTSAIVADVAAKTSPTVRPPAVEVEPKAAQARPAAPGLSAPKPSARPAAPSPAARPPAAQARPAPPPAAAPKVDVVEAQVESDAPEVTAAVAETSETEAPTIKVAAPRGRSKQRPGAPIREEERKPRGPWPIVAAIVVFVVVVAVGSVAYLKPYKPGQTVLKPDVEAPSAVAPPPAKIGERAIQPADAPLSADPKPVADAKPTVADAKPSADAKPGADAKPALAVDNPIPTAAGGDGSARAALLVAVPTSPQNPDVKLGSVVWSLIPPVDGQPATTGVKAEIDVPDMKLRVTMTIRKNTDPGIAATHTIDFRAAFADGAPVKGINEIAMPQMRREEPAGVSPLVGVRVKINDGYFLVGLDKNDVNAAQNADLLSTRNWFDFPMLLSDSRLAKLTFEKSPNGEKALAQAMAAWK